MKWSLLFFLLSFMQVFAHPGIGIVNDSRGNIYYTDLEQVWKVAPDGSKTIAVRGVHTHELYMDDNDALFGQHSIYSGEGTNRWFHYIWRLRPNGILDTMKPLTEGFFIENYSFARDAAGNMYWVQQGEKERIVKTTPQGTTTVLATGAFKRVQWLLPLGDTVYFVQEDGIYYIDHLKNVKVLAKKISNRSEGHNTLFGLWADAAKNIYVANATANKVMKISPQGVVQDFYSSEGDWAPTGGLFDNKGALWVLEYNTRNEARVHKVSKADAPAQNHNWFSPMASLLLPLSVIAAGVFAAVFGVHKIKKRERVV